MIHDPAFWIVTIFAVILVGLGKGGLAGLGALATPFMALAMPPMQAAAILLPILLVQDVVSVWSFRKSWNGWIIAWMLPGALAGVGIGYLFSASLSVRAVMATLGAITLGFGLYRLWVERGGRFVAASTSPGWVGSLFGVATGFASHIAHAGGPPLQMWVTPRKLPHETYLGTASIIFAVVNWAKVPAYAALGEFSTDILVTSAIMVPLAIASTLAGVWIIRRIRTRAFYTLVYAMMVLLGGKLIWDALA
ncbi:MAG: sulfite exporter TauE/SafE family protein [Blastomonas sp.]